MIVLIVMETAWSDFICMVCRTTIIWHLKSLKHALGFRAGVINERGFSELFERPSQFTRLECQAIVRKRRQVQEDF